MLLQLFLDRMKKQAFCPYNSSHGKQTPQTANKGLDMTVVEAIQNLFTQGQTGDKRKFKRAIRQFWQTMPKSYVHWRIQSKHAKKAWKINKPQGV